MKNSIELKTKTQEVLGSQNFFVSLITLIFLALNFNGAGIPDGVAAEIYESFKTGNITTIFFVLFPNLINPIIKIVKNKVWSWDFVRSANFWTQLGTVLLMLLVAYGINFPDGALAEIVGSIMKGDVGLIIAAIGINVVNPLYHFFKPKKGIPLNPNITLKAA